MHPQERLRTEIGRPSNMHARYDQRRSEWEYPVTDETSFREYAQVCLRAQRKSEVLTERAERPPAYVSDGRWVIDCLCGAGNAADPEWGVAICCECGNVYRPIFPPDWRAAEQALLRRVSPHTRHWFPDDTIARRYGFDRGETVNDLHTQNELMERRIR